MSQLYRNQIIKNAVLALLLVLIAVASGTAALAQNDNKPKPDLTEMSLEDLMNVRVTSVSKKQETLWQTAAAIYVITQDDIRHSGATSIPELLRMVPGVDVARINANIWAVSIRGFNTRFANKLLVMIDGRSIYTPFFSGVHWNMQDLMLEDAERIEVIRGPGGTLWGANAVNGVINIITKSAADTQGGLVTAVVGSQERGLGSARYGGTLGRHAHYRVYTKFFNQGPMVDSMGRAADDQWDVIHGGFRIDWMASRRDSVTWQGDIYRGDAGQVTTTVSPAAPLAGPTIERPTMAGGNLLLRWNRLLAGGSDMTLQLYFDRSQFGDAIDESRNTFDLDFQHHVKAGPRHDIVWGLGYRFTTDHGNSLMTDPLAVDPASRDLHLFSVFAQDEITLARNRLRLTIGSKIEHHDYTGFEVQPNVRVLWTPRTRHSLWAAVSRAIRIPSRIEEDGRLNVAGFRGAGGTPTVIRLIGNRTLTDEHLLAYELGYRVQPSRRVSLDLATFYNDYDHLVLIAPQRPFLETTPRPPHLVLPMRFENGMHGYTYGLEAAAHWDVTSYWKLTGSSTWFRMRLQNDLPHQTTTPQSLEGKNPQYQWTLRSDLNLPRNFEFDTSVYYVSRLRTYRIPGYTRVDVRFGWRPTEKVEMSFGLDNLLDNRHPEFSGAEAGVFATEVKRNVYGRITWRL